MTTPRTFAVACAAALALTTAACGNDTSSNGGSIATTASASSAGAPTAAPTQTQIQTSTDTQTGSAPATPSATSPANTPMPTNTSMPGKPPAGQTTVSPPTESRPTSPSPTTGSTNATTSAAAAREAITKVPRGLPDRAWVVVPEDNHFDAAAPLSYIVLRTDGGTASSPSQIALFHRGDYLGTATREAYGFHPQVTRTAPGALSVRYLYIVGDECTACASGRATAQFTWDDAAGKVRMTGELPPR